MEFVFSFTSHKNFPINYYVASLTEHPLVIIAKPELRPRALHPPALDSSTESNHRQKLLARSKSCTQTAYAKVHILSFSQTLTARHNGTLHNERYFPFNYQPSFDDDDTLGCHYASLLKHSLLYLKFDNRLFFSSPENMSQYLAGLFVPLHTLLKPELKMNKDLYKTLSLLHDLNYYSYEDSV
jgi:hypothetical protein